MNFWRWTAGEVEVALTCADREHALQILAQAGIDLRDGAQTDDLTVQFTVAAGNLRQIQAIADKKGWDLKIVSRTGLWRSVRTWLARPVLTFGILLILAASAYLPGRVLFVRVEGNPSVPTRLILEKASGCGIGFGASRQAVRSQKMKDALLESMPELQWAGVNTAGCVATITVRERADEPEPEENRVSSIVASMDGVITDLTVTQGTARFQVGQAVKRGEVLISGYTDCGFCIRAQRAKGEIFARTDRDLSVVTPSNWEQTIQVGQSAKKIALIIGKKRINFYKDSGNSGEVCGKMYKEYYITLPGGFQLPVSIVTERWSYGESTEITVEEDAAARLLSSFSQRYLGTLMTAGTVTEERCDLTAGKGIYCLNGNYACIEMIGRQRNEENLIGKYD